ncbi:MAG TPA: carbohydrate ABC transporter permease [Candidatus Dormibacteraeota bacterium]|nr:carbohydrate ABC transporter permease [Candidatus Dormibacteraeota bacterium]
MRLTLDRPVAYVAIVALCAVMVFPFVWMLSSSLKPFSEIFAGTTFLPEHPTLANYQSLFQQNNAVLKLWNSFYIATAATAISVFLCSLGGYAFAKFRFPGRGLLFSLMLASMALPFAVVMVPLFVMMRNVFHWIDTPWPLIIPGAANAFGIFFMRQYMLSVPDEMLDAARVDGASEFGIFWRIVLPTSIPGLISLSIIFFMSSWNNFLWPLAILHSDSAQTVPVMLNSLQGPPGRTAFDVLMAGSVVSVLPMLALFLVLQRRLVAGITSGAIKG